MKEYIEDKEPLRLCFFLVNNHYCSPRVMIETRNNKSSWVSCTVFLKLKAYRMLYVFTDIPENQYIGEHQVCFSQMFSNGVSFLFP